MNKQRLKAMACKAVDARREQIIAIGQDLFMHPELGYKEYYTAGVVQRIFDELGIPYRAGIGLTGVRADLKGRNSKAKVAIMGELDAILCADHSHADGETGAAHACGHHAQIAGLLGVAMCLRDTGLMAELDGDVALMAVPAEEYVEIEYRNTLRSQGEISFLGGKQEFIALGEFDDIDMAMMFHLNGGEKQIRLGSFSNGFIGKLIKYKGAATRPIDGSGVGADALNAAMLGVMGLRAQRGTYKEEDNVRIHPMITTGRCSHMNIVASDVQMETYVRGASIEAIIAASKKVDETLRAGADAVGAKLEITQLPGYLPRHNDQSLVRIFKENAITLVGEDAVDMSHSTAGSSDIGDLSTLMPVIHPYIGGVKGLCHSSDFMVDDEEFTYINATKLLLMSLIDLLADDAAEAVAASRQFKPLHTKETYLQMWQDLCRQL